MLSSRYKLFLCLLLLFFFLFQKCLFYTLCTFYHLCKLCLYEILSSSLSLSVNELAFISYVGFVLFFLFVCLFVVFGKLPISGSEANGMSTHLLQSLHWLCNCSLSMLLFV